MLEHKRTFLDQDSAESVASVKNNCFTFNKLKLFKLRLIKHLVDEKTTVPCESPQGGTYKIKTAFKIYTYAQKYFLNAELFKNLAKKCNELSYDYSNRYGILQLFSTK